MSRGHQGTQARTPITAGCPGAATLEVLLAQPRAQVAHRTRSGLLLEVEMRRDGRPEPVPFVLGYTPRPAGGWTLAHAYAGASTVTVQDDGGYLFLSDMRPGGQWAGRSLWRHRPNACRDPEPLLRTPRGIVSYAAARSTVVAAAWMDATAHSLAEDRDLAATRAPGGRTATVVRGDLWPRSAYQADGSVLRLLQLGPGGAHPVLVPVGLDPGVRLTGELALTPDGGRCAAGVVRFLRGGHRRYGLLMFSLADSADVRPVWADADLTEAVAAPDGAWFACTAERLARPGRAPRHDVVLVASDGSRTRPAVAAHPDWLRPRAWAGPDTLLAVGEQNGRRQLWRVTSDARAERIDVAGSVVAVTATIDEALVVRSGIDLPPEVVSVPLAVAQRSQAHPVIAPAATATPRGRIRRLAYHAPDGSAWHSVLCQAHAEPDAPRPVLVWCHGGPMLSWTDWSWRWNPWPFVALGYAVLMPDPPLSVGYGQEAVERGWGRWTSEVAAVAAAQVRAALADPGLDEDQVAVMGGSFGGYLALALGTLLPVRLIASHCGWADFAAVARASDLHWHWLREYGPVEDSAAYRRESLRLDRIGPDVTVLLSHGCDDTHVPVGETRAVYRSLEARGVDVRLMLFPDERHSVRRLANITAWYQWVLKACGEVLDRPATYGSAGR